MQATRVHSLTPEQAATFAARVQSLEPTATGCLIWPGLFDRYGYGVFRFRVAGNKRQTGAHRAAWIVARGPVPPGLVIDHLCRNRACVNVDHLELVTSGENTRRSDLIGSARPTHCKHGHEFTPENTHVYTTTAGYTARICIQCRRRRTREQRARARR